MAEDFGGFSDDEANDFVSNDSGGDFDGFGFIEVDEKEDGFGIEFVSEEEFQKEQEQWKEEDATAARALAHVEEQIARDPSITEQPPTFDSTPQPEAVEPSVSDEPETQKKEVEILGFKKGWCQYKLIGKGATTMMRKNKWKPVWVDLSREGLIQLKKMPNDTEVVAKIEVPYAKLMDDPGNSKLRFAMGLKSSTYYFEANTENEVELWMLNIEKAKKRNRRRSAYGQQTSGSTLMVF